METKLLTENSEDLELAAKIIADGGLVAFPTETVYGLGANALDPDAVARIYEVKQRPSDNPSIVHISEKNQIEPLTVRVTTEMRILMDRFWPGPLTMIALSSDLVPTVTRGGQPTVGIRLPESRTARELIRKSGCPVAAPSANISGRPSPTTAQDVFDDLNGEIHAIIDGGPCSVGIESTVIDMTGDIPMILRPGIITKEDFEEALGREILTDPMLNVKPELSGVNCKKPKSPGQKYRHYAPKAKMIIFEGEPDDVRSAIDEERMEREVMGQKVKTLIFESDERKAARDFFAELREADRNHVDVILAAALPEKGIGFSVMNRMLKSAGYNIRKV